MSESSTTTATTGSMNTTMGQEGTTQGREVRRVQIRNVIQDQRYQIRAKLNQGMVKRYASAYKNGGSLPPVQVAQVGDALILVDGWHRLAALTEIGESTAEAKVIPATERAALWLAAQANLKHGLALTSKEIRQAFRAYIKARQHIKGKGGLKSYRDIASDLGGVRSHVAIWGWMIKDFPKVAEQMQEENMPKGDGGLKNTDPEASFWAITQHHLDKARAAFNGVNGPEARGRVIHKVEAMLEEMKRGHFTPYEPDF